MPPDGMQEFKVIREEKQGGAHCSPHRPALAGCVAGLAVKPPVPLDTALAFSVSQCQRTLR